MKDLEQAAVLYIHIYIYIYIYMCVCVCIYIYIYTIVTSRLTKQIFSSHYDIRSVSQLRSAVHVLCIDLYITVQPDDGLQCTVLHCSVLYCTALYCTLL